MYIHTVNIRSVSIQLTSKILKPLAALLILSISSCSTMQSIHARQTYKFNVDATDNRIFYETGTENAATLVSQHIDEYLEQIEFAQYGQFRDPSKIKIYLFDDKERYVRFRFNTGKSSFGGASTNEVYISVPRIRERLSSDLCQTTICNETLEGILMHELSHIHTRQHIGTWRYVTDVPKWYNEGLATLISNGAGAGSVTELEAKKFILSGSHLIPHNSGRFFKRAETTGDLRNGSFRFYRQAKMFVEYLRNTNPSGFKNALIQLRKGESFHMIWKTNYGTHLDNLWAAFKLSL